MFGRVHLLFALLSTAWVFAGCGGGAHDRWSADRPETVPAGGTVLYNEKPVAGADVVLIPQGHEQGAVGRTDASGKFQMQTFDPGDGAVPGDYKVTIRKVELPSAGQEDAPEFDDDSESTAEEVSLLPKRYGSKDSTDLTVTIPEEGTESLKFELTD